MSEPSLVRGQYVNILLGNGATPEVFTVLCGITTRSFTEQANTSDTFVRDCALPDNIPFRRVNITGKQWDLSGAGLLNTAQLDVMRATFAITKNWRFDIARPTGATAGGGNFTGPAILESIKYGASDGEFTSIDLTMKSDGSWAYTTLP